jgi:hypothetical protein
LVLFCQSQSIVGKPLSLCAREAGHGFAHLYHSTLVHPLGKEEGGNAVLPSMGEF